MRELHCVYVCDTVCACALWSRHQVFVIFETEEGAKAALLALAGCLFLDRIVVCTFSTQEALEAAIEKNAIMPETMYPNLATSLIAAPTYT